VSTTVAERVKKRFRLVVGIHSEVTGYNPSPPEGDGRAISRTYMPGEIIESFDDLAKMHNTRTSVRFVRMYSEREAEERAEHAVDDPLESLTLRQLFAVAKDEGIDVSEMTAKDEVIAAIRKANVGA
jgi:hypothetical protein